MSDQAGVPRVITIMGPTASGKTALAVALAKVIDAEIISVDSALVYRGLDIGAAKPSMVERGGVPHHLIDIRDPSQPYTAGDFCDDASARIKQVIDAGKTPILVGGTMMYFKALLEGLSTMPQGDPLVRAAIESEAEAKGWPHMHQQLRDIDALSADKIHPNHSQRISRALEVYRITGKPLSSYHGHLEGGLQDEYRWVQFALTFRHRQVLHERIALRFTQMLQAGFLNEVRTLMARGDLNVDLPAIRAVGYRQAWQHLEGAYGEQEMIEKALAATRQLAKRQMTWLRSWSNLCVLNIQKENVGQFVEKEELIASALKIIEKRVI